MSIVAIGTLAVLAALLLATQIGVAVIERLHPPQGRFIDVAGGRLHVLDIGPRDAAGPPIVLIHGASSNLKAMQWPLGDRLAKTHRVLLIDRPGHGWSTRDDLAVSSPLAQARAVVAALDALKIDKAVVVVHSLAGALGARLALDFPQRLAGLAMLAPVTHPWPGGVGAYNDILTTPLLGPLLANTITLPLGALLATPAARVVFLPQIMPDNYVAETATLLLLRPREMLANAWDLTTLKAAVEQQAPRYGEIRVPTVILMGDADKTVSLDIHARRFAAAVSTAKLIVLPNSGHMVQNAVPDLAVREIEALVAGGAAEAAALR